MMKEQKQLPRWKVRSLSSDYEWEGSLTAYWEVSSDPISDDYTPREINARDLFDIWANQVHKQYPNNLIPIFWFVECKEQGKFAYAPFQFNHFLNQTETQEDFLSIFNWPISPITGERLNWLTLPVVNKQWNIRHSDKGGFIQDATSWKPSIFQPFVYLPLLESIKDISKI